MGKVLEPASKNVVFHNHMCVEKNLPSFLSYLQTLQPVFMASINYWISTPVHHTSQGHYFGLLQ